MNAIAHLRPPTPESPDATVLLAAIEALPEGVAITQSGRVLYVNPAWAQMFESDALCLQGRALEDFIPLRPPQIVPGKEFENGSAIASAEKFTRVRTDGTQLDLEVSSHSFRARGREFRVIGTRDVARQAHTEKRLRQSQRMEAIGWLVGGVAHDFNNLLTGMMLYCDLLMTELEKESRSHLHVQAMRVAGEHAARLVQQLLAVVRPQPRATRPVSLNEVISSIKDLLTRLIGENLTLSTSLAGDLAWVTMDAGRVQQVIVNLLLNARDAMPEGGGITLITRNSPDHPPPTPEQNAAPASRVELIVADTGCGMDASTLTQAFEPFFTTKKGRGSGLGLAAVNSLVKEEGGTVEVESEPGKGTRVVVRLPCVRLETPSHPKTDEVIDHDHRCHDRPQPVPDRRRESPEPPDRGR
jgi:PAS domain S-box-containing protein